MTTCTEITYTGANGIIVVDSVEDEDIKSINKLSNGEFIVTLNNGGYKEIYTVAVAVFAAAEREPENEN